MLYSSLTQEDKNKIKAYINNYAYAIPHDEDEPIDLEYSLRFWNEAKEKIFKMFGNKFILEKEISFTAPEPEGIREISIRLENFAFIKNLVSKIGDYQTMLITALSDMYNNTFTGTTFYISLPDGKDYKVQHGCKLNRVYTQLAKKLNIESVDEFVTFLSQVGNQKTIKGTLCLSIHPLDYFTLSDNDCGWTSCLSWRSQGGYSSGPVAAMNDPYLVVAYLKSNTDMQFSDNYSWNSKKWRELFIVHPEIVTHIKPYPYVNEDLEKECLEWLKEMIGDGWTDLVKICHWGEVMGKFDLNFQHLYDDFNRVSEHKGYVKLPLLGKTTKRVIYLADDLNCPICGERYNPDYEGQRVCNDCEAVYYCEECGCPILETEGVRYEDDWYCNSCYQNLDERCDICGEYFHVDDLSADENEDGVPIMVCYECQAAFGTTEEI